MLFSQVLKFGGTGLADGPAVQRVCSIVAARALEGPAVVVSAHEGVTHALERCARRAATGEFDLEEVRIRHKSLLRQLGLDPELLDRLLSELGQILFSISDRRSIQAEELDFVLSMGERMSARIVAAALRMAGHEATPVDAFDLGLTTDSCHGQARPLPGVEGSLRRSLSDIPGVPVITGFLAKDGSGNLTTMGRNGSDLTAALVAQASGARELIYWKTVPGLMTADPALVAEARVIEGLSLAEAEVTAFHGASVLHPSSLEPLRECTINVQLRDVRAPECAGSIIDGRPPCSGVAAIAGNRELVGLSVAHEGGASPATLFSLMHAHHVSPRFIQTDERKTLVYAPPSPGFEVLRRELSGRAEARPAMSSVVLVGGESSSYATRALERLREEGMMPSFSCLDHEGLGQVFLFEPTTRVRAARLLHEELIPLTSQRRTRSST